VRSEKAEILDAIHVLDTAEALENSVRGQYVGGAVNGSAVVPYRKAPDVAPDSTTETFVALKLSIDNWRWAGVPFYLRTGKAMARRRTEVAIKFKEAPFAMFRATEIDRLAQNFLTIGIQPEETIALQFNAKVPGPAMALEGVEMTFNYKDYFAAAPSTGYETLIYDCMLGDALLFQRADGVEAGWRAVQPFLDAWHEMGGKGLATYAAGSEGPPEAAALLARDGRRWRSLMR
jgi:glucose-6-phosphate 1-dehydrogenase